MKKGLIILLAVCFVFAGVTWVSAAQNVANTSQKGSLLIFPKVEVSDTRDTIIEINNDASRFVYVKCYWVDETQDFEDFMFFITPNQPVWFSARTGMGMMGSYKALVPPFFGERGELKCWAVDEAGYNQISYNHLYGEATIFHYDTNQSLGYNSWNFAARNARFRQPVGEPGYLRLDGAYMQSANSDCTECNDYGSYDACPYWLNTDFIAQGAPFRLGARTLDALATDLTIVPCKQDLRQDRVPTFTKLKYDVWNENETKYTGAWQCIKCWFEGLLHETQHGAEKFTYNALHTPKGRLRIQGIASTVCPGSQDSPLLGVVFKQFQDPATQVVFESATNPNTAGYDPSGFIRWDYQPDVIPESVK